jgi:hypothetical protein
MSMAADYFQLAGTCQAAIHALAGEDRVANQLDEKFATKRGGATRHSSSA